VLGGIGDKGYELEIIFAVIKSVLKFDHLHNFENILKTIEFYTLNG
jgi:hypothetical protein